MSLATPTSYGAACYAGSDPEINCGGGSTNNGPEGCGGGLHNTGGIFPAGGCGGGNFAYGSGCGGGNKGEPQPLAIGRMPCESHAQQNAKFQALQHHRNETFEKLFPPIAGFKFKSMIPALRSAGITYLVAGLIPESCTKRGISLLD